MAAPAASFLASDAAGSIAPDARPCLWPTEEGAGAMDGCAKSETGG